MRRSSGPLAAPLDPQSAKGQEVARRLTETLAAIRLEIAERRRAQQVYRSAA